MNLQNKCRVCGQRSLPGRDLCDCGATLPAQHKERLKSPEIETPRESYEEYYQRVIRQYGEAAVGKILTPDQAKAMWEEIQDNRRAGKESPVFKEEVRLKNFLQIFGKQRN